MSRRTPLVSIGQGDYRRDYHGDEFRAIPWLMFFAAMVLISVAAIALDSLNQPSGARTDESRPAQTASAGLTAPEAPHAR